MAIIRLGIKRHGKFAISDIMVTTPLASVGKVDAVLVTLTLELTQG